MQRSPKSIVVGIDVSKALLDVAASVPFKMKQVTNDSTGIAKLTALLRDLSPKMIVLEATGGYQRAVVDAFHVARLPVSEANPRKVRAFAVAAGVLSKTDKIDARTLVQFGSAMEPEPTLPVDPASREVAEIQTRHRQLIENRTAEKNRVKIAPTHLQEGINRHIAWLDEEIDQIEQRIKDLIKVDSFLSAKYQIVTSVPGVGPATAAALLGHFPELGRIASKQAASLAGLAPFADDSGRRSGKRFIRHGRANIRSAMYMATLSAIRFAAPFSAFYQRLIGVGKPKKLAIVACMRKLITTLNSMVRNGQVWSPPVADATLA